jgi:hypothetical protein
LKKEIRSYLKLRVMGSCTSEKRIVKEEINIILETFREDSFFKASNKDY